MDAGGIDVAENMNGQDREILGGIAERAMREKGLEPDFPQAVYSELKGLGVDSAEQGPSDMTDLPWCSIDNDDSADLDQLTAAKTGANGLIIAYVAVSDVDAVVPKGSAIDAHAGLNTLSIYTPARIFPMLPPALSTDLTSLRYGVKRKSIVVEMAIDKTGEVVSTGIRAASIVNRAKLAYDGVAAWLDGTGPAPLAMAPVEGLDDNLKLQQEAASRLRQLRHSRGALSFESQETHAVFDGGRIKRMAAETKNSAKMIIEDLMIAANGAIARFLESKGFASIRRVVHTPKRWDRIVELAGEMGAALPAAPDAAALEGFLCRVKSTQPERYMDVSISVIKLLGPGEYCLELPGASTDGHFGLAVKDYTHSTAPNRRYADIITQRLVKSAIAGRPQPYAAQELDGIAKRCTQKENDAKKVERQMSKSAAALLMQDMAGREFDAMVTGASEKGTWVRIFDPNVEGKLGGNTRGLDVGHRLRVRLVSTDVEKGFIDFAPA